MAAAKRKGSLGWRPKRNPEVRGPSRDWILSHALLIFIAGEVKGGLRHEKKKNREKR